MLKIGHIHMILWISFMMWTYSYTVLRICIHFHKANRLKHLLKESTYFKHTKMIEKGFKYRNIKMTIYRYGKLQKLETRKDFHSYIDQVKGVIDIHVDKNGAMAELKSRRRLGNKPMSCKQGSQVRFSASPSLSYETLSCGPSSDTL